MSWKWRIDARGYVTRNDPSGTQIYMHRQLLDCRKGDGTVVDHENGNTLDNRLINLRKTNKAGNAQNRHDKGRGTSIHRGVSWADEQGKWRASATLKGKTYHLGLFEEEQEAANVAANFRAKYMPFSEEATKLRMLREGAFTEELADVVIRVLDLAGYYNLDLGEAVMKKIEMNRERDRRHGKRF